MNAPERETRMARLNGLSQRVSNLRYSIQMHLEGWKWYERTGSEHHRQHTMQGVKGIEEYMAQIIQEATQIQYDAELFEREKDEKIRELCAEVAKLKRGEQ